VLGAGAGAGAADANVARGDVDWHCFPRGATGAGGDGDRPRARRRRNSRRVDVAITNIDGEYELKGLPPGRYAIAVIDELDRDALRRPDALANLTPVASVTLTLGETITLPIVLR
jgi:hypothetical protein